MEEINKLSELFRKFPGIGPRQARRFVYYLLRKDNSFHKELAKRITDLNTNINVCQSCQRYFETSHNMQMCNICADSSRDKSKLLIISNDQDHDTVAKSQSYDGLFFVLGGIVPILDEAPEKRVRANTLKKIVDSRKNDLKEIILATSANPEGENTANFVRNLLSDITDHFDIKITTLGRGLSTGVEIEYSDDDTISNALRGRH